MVEVCGSAPRIVVEGLWVLVAHSVFGCWTSVIGALVVGFTVLLCFISGWIGFHVFSAGLTFTIMNETGKVSESTTPFQRPWPMPAIL
jgi:hypothetical protein